MKRALSLILAVSFFQTIAMSQVVVQAKDKTTPALKSSVPLNNQKGIKTNVVISLKFSENIYKSKYFAKIKLTRSGKAVSIKTSISKTLLKLIRNIRWHTALIMF